MATAEQILAAADRARAAGDTAAEKVLRDRASKMSAPEVAPERIVAAAQKAKAAGDMAAHDVLMARVSMSDLSRGHVPVSEPVAQAAPEPPAPRPQVVLPRPDPTTASVSDVARSLDEYVPGSGYADVMRGGPRVPPQKPAPQADTGREDWLSYPMDASTVTDIPVGKDEATGATIWQTISGKRYMRGKTRQVPMQGEWSDVSAGDVGNALGNLAVGVGQSIAAGVQAPGNALAGQPVTQGDVLATASLAIPDAPASRGAAVRGTVPVATQATDDVAAATARGIPVMRTDVAPPKTFIGRNVQKIGESIPVAGTGGMRARQNAARIEAAQNLVRDYGADVPASAIDDVTASVLARRKAELTRYTGDKTRVIDRAAKRGVVKTPKALAAIDEQIASLETQGLQALQPVIAKLRDFRQSLIDQPLNVLEQNRKVIGEAFSDPGLAAIKSVGEKALNAVYGPLRADMGDFIKGALGQSDFLKWKVANDRLASMAGDLKNTAMKRVLQSGEASPEVVRQMLFSNKPSDIARLYHSLTPEGQSRARTAILQEALGKAGGLQELSPEKFKTAIGKLGPQISVFFRDGDFEAVNGLARALKLTERAGTANVAPLTGVQTLPAAIVGLASIFTNSTAGLIGTVGTAGLMARAYESTGVQRALRALARAETPAVQTTVLKSLAAALNDAGIALGQTAVTDAANTSRPPLRATAP
jgi:hypothetical protein